MKGLAFLLAAGLLCGAAPLGAQGIEWNAPSGGATADPLSLANITGTTSNCGGAAAAAANSVCLSANTITSEGATDNAFEGLIVFGDHTADATATFTAIAGGMQLSLGSGTAASTAIVLGGTTGIYRDSGSGGLGIGTGGTAQIVQNAQLTEHRSTSILTWMTTDTPVAGTRDVGLTRSPSTAGTLRVTTGTTQATYGSIEAAGFSPDKTITAAGTTGAQTINKVAGTVNFAAAATAIDITNSTVTTSSICMTTIRTADTTCTFVKSAVPTAGHLVITVNAGCNAETSVGFMCF